MSTKHQNSLINELRTITTLGLAQVNFLGKMTLIFDLYLRFYLEVNIHFGKITLGIYWNHWNCLGNLFHQFQFQSLE